MSPIVVSRDIIGPLGLQISHLFLSCVWNLAGVMLIANGRAPLGPSASMVTVVILILLGLLLIYGLVNYGDGRYKGSRQWLVYLAVSTILLLATISTIFAAFTKDPVLWPSSWWRYAGIVLNSIGLIGAIWGGIKVLKY